MRRAAPAFETYGFLYLENHGVPAAVVDAVFDQARIFFALPTAVKEAARPQDPRNTLGYGGLGGQALENGRPPELERDLPGQPGEPWARPNVWPEGLPGFREAIMAFHAAATNACERLMQAIAVSLGLPEGYFEPFYDRSDSTARLLHYPRWPSRRPGADPRRRAHRLRGVNLLFPAEGGLEIQAPDGAWLPTPARGTGIVNTGDLIERWTNGLFRSSPHRVVNPEGRRRAARPLLARAVPQSRTATPRSPAWSPARAPRGRPATPRSPRARTCGRASRPVGREGDS